MMHYNYDEKWADLHSNVNRKTSLPARNFTSELSWLSLLGFQVFIDYCLQLALSSKCELVSK